jgi:hypothetical protein
LYVRTNNPAGNFSAFSFSGKGCRALLLGKVVYDRRIALGLTRAELAAKAGMT